MGAADEVPDRSRAAIHGALELGLRHRRAPLDPSITGLVPELVVRSPARAFMRAESPAPRRREVLDRGSARGLRLAGAGPLLVHRPGGDLLGLAGRRSAIEETVLDVLELPFAFVGPRSLGHRSTSGSARRSSRRAGPSCRPACTIRIGPLDVAVAVGCHGAGGAWACRSARERAMCRTRRQLIERHSGQSIASGSAIRTRPWTMTAGSARLWFVRTAIVIPSSGR